MKDILIKGTTIKREIIFYLASLLIAILLNVYSIWKFGTEWNELFTQFFVVLILSFVIYLLLWPLRLLVRLIFRALRGKG